MLRNRYLWAVAGLFWAASAALASQFTDCNGVACANGQVTLQRQWQTLLSEGFEADLSAWVLDNFENTLSITPSVQEHHTGQKALVLTHIQGPDTAWELKSQPIAVSANSPIILSFWLKTNRSLTSVLGHGNSYQSHVEWLDKTGKVIGVLPIHYGEAAPEWREISIESRSPAGATHAILKFGFDAPNITTGDVIAFDDLALQARAEKSPFISSGTCTSRPFQVRANATFPVTWKADCPKGTSVSLQTRTAAGGKWSPERWGAWNSQAKVAGTAGGWVQYRAVLTTTKPLVTPVLRRVQIGSGTNVIVDAGWTGCDVTPPRLGEHSPTRTAEATQSLRFTIHDDGVGIDCSSVQMRLDGQVVKPSYEGSGRYFYKPPQPLTPPTEPLGFQGWRCQNFANALTVKPTPPRKEDGAESIALTHLAGDADTAFKLVSPEIAVAAGEAYTLSFWLKTDLDLRGVDDSYGGGLCWLDKDLKPLGARVPIAYGGPATDWREMRQQVIAPTGTQWATIGFGFDQPNIANGHFLQFADARLEGPHPQRPGGVNLHQVDISATDYAGNRRDWRWFILVKEPPTSGRVTVRKDGVCLVDDKPFFPIGIYAIEKRADNGFSYDTALDELKAAGFNTVHTYSSLRGAEFSELYQAVARHKMKMWVGTEAGNNSADVQGALQTVARECNEPGLLAWYLADDTASWIGPDELQRVSEAVLEVDPYHITTQADGCAGLNDQRYLSHVNSTTGFMPELYPIHQQTDNHIADVIRGMKNVQTAWQAARRITPTWAIIQCFEGWGWQRYPTNEEERCMVYLALIHGAQGITWYTYSYRDDKHGAPWSPSVWANLKSIATELSSLREVMTSVDPQERPNGQVLNGPQTGDLDYPSLNLRLKRWAGKWYLLAANSANQPISVRLTLPGLKDRVEVLFEKRQVAAKSGQFEDTFAPLGVHVYQW